mmetsp:Transcript_81865/g.155382  ORF Transcript_81865/g.155382 Transcript_81865/m.155382 type:complete len:94 (-) Transcript_81865:8-289(-)
MWVWQLREVHMAKTKVQARAKVKVTEREKASKARAKAKVRIVMSGTAAVTVIVIATGIAEIAGAQTHARALGPGTVGAIETGKEYGAHLDTLA